MTAVASLGAEHVVAVAEEVFAAMVDCESGLLVALESSCPLMDPVYAWVEVRSDDPRRIVLAIGAAAADDLARALLRLADGAPVCAEDIVDAIGEVANVVGGNLKSLVPAESTLTLPRVQRDAPPRGRHKLDEVALAWRGQPLVITVWQL